MKYLIVGLGNIGSEYEETRHNVGFKVLEALVPKSSFKADRLAHSAEYKFKGRTFVLIKPTTYMNLSGKAVKYWMQKEKIPLERVLIVTDDIALPFGTLRMKEKGSDGGHNGLKNINELLETNQYLRLRFGVGAEFSKGKQIDYVLGEWTIEESVKLKERIEMTHEFIRGIATIGIPRTMSNFNNK